VENGTIREIQSMAGVVKVEEDCTSMDRNLLTKAAEKVIFFRLLKNGQMQGTRNPESGVTTNKK